MGLFGAVASFIGGIVSSVITTITSIVGAIVAAVTAAVSYIVLATANIVASLTAITTEFIALTMARTYASLAIVTANMQAVLTMPYSYLSNWLTTLHAAFSGFLEAIHFDLLTRIHSIAYLVSEDYRLMMEKIWTEIREFSLAIGAPAGYIETAIQFGREVVLSTSAFLGKRYDLGEVQWLTDFQGLMRRVNATATLYNRHPERIWNDINELIVRPATNAKAAAQLGILTTIDGVLKTVDITLTRFDKFRGELELSISKLPEKWREDARHYMSEALRSFDNWRNETYYVYVDKIDLLMRALSGEQQQNRSRLQELVGVISRGGDLLGRIDLLPDAEKTQQENKISDIASRALQRDFQTVKSYTKQEYQELSSILKVVELPTMPEAWQIEESRGLFMPIGKQAATRVTWFVGDY
jgi:hypothetical protein